MLRAWETEVQREAVGKAAELFPNLPPQMVEDEEAFCNGSAFTEPEHDEEWMGWVDWSEVEGQTGGAGSSA